VIDPQFLDGAKSKVSKMVVRYNIFYMIRSVMLILHWIKQKLTLMIKMEVDNLTEVVPQDDFEFQMNVSSTWSISSCNLGLLNDSDLMQIMCTSCREVHGNAVSLSSKVRSPHEPLHKPYCTR
jgi:hypothetical protein